MRISSERGVEQAVKRVIRVMKEEPRRLPQLSLVFKTKGLHTVFRKMLGRECRMRHIPKIPRSIVWSVDIEE